MTASLPWAVLLFGLTGLAWIFYFRWKDAHRPEPWILTLLCVGGGGVSALLSLLGYEGLALLGVGTHWEQLTEGELTEAVFASLRIAAIEETAKLLPVIALALRRREFDEELDGIVYAALAAIGFALAESATLWWGGLRDPTLVLARALTSPLTHALFTAPAGLGLSLLLFRKTPWTLVVGAGASIALHALYNGLLARSQPSSLWSALVVAAVWLWLLRAVPKHRHHAVGL